MLKAAGVLAAAPAVGSLAWHGVAGALPRADLDLGLGVPARDEERWQACQRLARDLLLVGPAGQDLTLEYLKVLIDDGLPRTRRPKKVLVVGAGMAGLVTGHLLKQAGHHVRIIEANGNRIGGRLKTFRTDPDRGLPAPFEDPGLYAEAGGMRIPDFHPLTLALIDKLGLRRRLFYNVDVVPDTGNQGAPVPAVTYTSFTGKVWRRGPHSTAFKAPTQANRAWIRTNGQQRRRVDYAKDSALINGGFRLSGEDGRRTSAAALDAVLQPVYDYYSDRGPDGTRRNKPVPEWIEGWAKLIYDLDLYSMERFLAEQAGLSQSQIGEIGTLGNLTSRLFLSFMHSFIDQAIINPQVTYWEIPGGNWALPYAFEPLLRYQLRMNHRMTRLEYWDPGRDCSGCKHVGPNGPKVWIETTSESGGDDAQSGSTFPRAQTFTGDVAVLTVPFSSLRHVDVEPLFSYPKRRAVIELHYDSATKVLLEFSRRWWEFTELDWKRELNAIRPGLYEQYRERARPADYLFGGGSVTDNPNRFMYYPSHPVPGSRGGVVLASYTWADDATRWDSLADSDRYDYALRGMQDVHGDRIREFYTGHGQTQSWLRNRYALGEAAVLAPGQLTYLHPAIPTPEGPVHFAGEHTSLKHAWIEGAVESGVRAALEVNG
jgi:monoamine oxidase